MAKEEPVQLSRRERQIMDVVYRLGRATAAEVLEDLPDAPSNATIRTLLRILEEKGHLKHTKEGPRYVYLPTRSRGAAARLALRRVLKTFFEGSTAKAVAALLDLSDADLTPEELDRLSSLIEQAKREGSQS